MLSLSVVVVLCLDNPSAPSLLLEYTPATGLPTYRFRELSRYQAPVKERTCEIQDYFCACSVGGAWGHDAHLEPSSAHELM